MIDIRWLLIVTIIFVKQTFELAAFLHAPLSVRRDGSISHKSFAEPAITHQILEQEELLKLEALINERSQLRWAGEYEKADEKRAQIEAFDLPDGYEIDIKDLPRRDGGGSEWSIVSNSTQIGELLPGSTLLQLAHAALGLAVQYSSGCNLQRTDPNHFEHSDQSRGALQKVMTNEYEKALNEIVQQCKVRLEQDRRLVALELSGRKAADAAFWFALAGVRDESVFDDLVQIATDELARFGTRNSCRPKDIFQILERFSASGVRSAPGLEKVAIEALQSKSALESEDLDEALLSYHSERSMLLIWKFSTKQKKQRAFLNHAQHHWERFRRTSIVDEEAGEMPTSSHVSTETDHVDWDFLFHDPTRPLVVDIGCGMGTSILGMASTYRETNEDPMAEYTTSVLFEPSKSWEDYNWIGVDLGALGIAYARGLSSRWGLEGRVAFVVDSAENLLEKVAETYPGRVQVCCIQFPTPYRLNQASDMNDDTEDFNGNSQLPISASDGFMVTPRLLALVRKALLSRCAEVDGHLLFQSNCEDVAVSVRNEACNNLGFEAIEVSSFEGRQGEPSSKVAPRLPKRTADWISMGGERAVGAGWAQGPILHAKGRTETEVACIINGTPIHRCLLRPTKE